MQIYTIIWQLTLKLTGPIFKYPNLIRRKYRREGPLSIVANLLLSQALNLADILKEKRLRHMHLKVSIINKDCKVNNHSLCPGYWIGLEMNVFCDCLCHNHRISDKSAKSTSAETNHSCVIFDNNLSESIMKNLELNIFNLINLSKDDYPFAKGRQNFEK